MVPKTIAKPFSILQAKVLGSAPIPQAVLKYDFGELERTISQYFEQLVIRGPDDLDCASELAQLLEQYPDRAWFSLSRQEVYELAGTLRGLHTAATHWRNNHQTEVARARILKVRTDLPLERTRAYDHCVEMELAQTALRDRLNAILADTTTPDKVRLAQIEALLKGV